MSWQRPTPARLGHDVHIAHQPQGATVTLDGVALRLAPGAPVDFDQAGPAGLVPVTLTVLADRLRFEHTASSPATDQAPATDRSVPASASTTQEP